MMESAMFNEKLEVEWEDICDIANARTYRAVYLSHESAEGEINFVGFS
jgi:hypothetical protein